MSLRDRLKKPGTPQGGQSFGINPTESKSPGSGNLSPNQSASGNAAAGQHSVPVGPESHTLQPKKGERFEEVKGKVHTMLVENLNISTTDPLGKEEVSLAAYQFLEKILIAEKVPMGTSERSVLIQELVEEDGIDVNATNTVSCAMPLRMSNVTTMAP